VARARGLAEHRRGDTAPARSLAAPQVAVQIPKEVLPILHIDPIVIEQVLVNILDNAAKYSPPGGRIEIAAALDGGRCGWR
jgi:two-component system sensor histidine kinase KdpD